MLNNNGLYDISNDELTFKNIKILKIEKVNDFLFIVLANGQRILTNGIEVYDVSSYSHLFDIFNMGDKFCAAMRKEYSVCVVDLKTMNVLFDDDKAYHISKQDDRTLHVIMKSGNNNIYDIETKKYLISPKDYEFENSLGNNLYVFKEKSDLKNNFYEHKRCVINADGELILKDIDGYIELYENYLIIKKQKEIWIVTINKDFSLDINIIEQNDKMLAKPVCYEGNIVIIEKGLIKILAPNLNLINHFEIKELESIIDYEIIANVLKLCLPYSKDGKDINKHLFINLKNGKSISHVRINEYPYWTPEVYVGKDDLIDEQLYNFKYGETYELTEYQFYDSDFNKIVNVKGNFCSEIENNIFIVGIWDKMECKRKYINIKTNIVKECVYDVVKFSLDNLYGYAFNTITDMIDIVDRNLCVVIPNIDYKRFGLNKYNDFFSDFNYFVVNDYVCIVKHVADGSRSFFRNIIQSVDGKIILDSMQCQCFPMGNLIQVIKNGKSEFLNTLTGKIGQLSITVSIDEEGKIDFNKINDLRNVFTIEENPQFLLSQSDLQSKKLIPNVKR